MKKFHVYDRQCRCDSCVNLELNQSHILKDPFYSGIDVSIDLQKRAQTSVNVKKKNPII
jgi:hypothetical protein